MTPLSRLAPFQGRTWSSSSQSSTTWRAAVVSASRCRRGERAESAGLGWFCGPDSDRVAPGVLGFFEVSLLRFSLEHRAKDGLVFP